MDTSKLSVDMLLAYWDRNPFYYEGKRDIISKGSLITWNWSAFFFGFLWLAYRKMFVYAALLIVLIWLSPSRLLSTFISFLLGMFGNYLYIKFSEVKAEEIRANNHDRESVLEELKVKGGVTYWGPVFMVLLFVVLVLGNEMLYPSGR